MKSVFFIKKLSETIFPFTLTLEAFISNNKAFALLFDTEYNNKNSEFKGLLVESKQLLISFNLFE